MYRSIALTLSVLASATLFSTVGCGDAPATSNTPATPSRSVPNGAHDEHAHDHRHDHGHGHDHEREDTEEVTSFHDAVHKLETLNHEIEEAVLAGDMKKADGPVHEIGHILEDLEGLAEKASLSEAEITVILKSRDKLFDAFGEFDKTLHGQEGAAYSDVSETIESALKSLGEIEERTEEKE